MKVYLGDGVYVAWNAAGLTLVLRAENGIYATNTIVLEPEVYTALVQFVERLQQGPAQREERS